MADDPVGRTLEPTPIDSRLPPVDPRRGRGRGGGSEGDRRRGDRRQSARAANPEEAERARRELQAEIDRGNSILQRQGHNTTLELVHGRDGAPDRVAICYPGPAGAAARCVIRTVRVRELQQWLARLEGLEGLVVDTTR